MSKKIGAINYKAIAVQAGMYALAFTLANRIFAPKSGGMGIASKALAFLPIEQQAKFADALTVENARNEKWLIEQTSNINTDDIASYQNINQTAIGNLAYIALYGVNDEAKRKAFLMLENIRNASL